MNQNIQPFAMSNIFFDIIIKSFSDLSINIKDIFKKKGMDARSKNIRFNMDEFNDYCDEIVSKTDLRNFGLKLSWRIAQYSMNGLVYSIMINSAIIEEAMENLRKYHKLLSNVIEPEMIIEDDMVVFSFDSSGLPEKFMWHYSESFACLILLNIRSLIKEEIFPDKIYLQRKVPKKLDEYLKIFGSNIHFNAEKTRIIFNKDLMKRSILFANEDLLNVLKNHAEKKTDELFLQNTWSYRVTNILNKLIYNKKPDIGIVARELALSDRNLQNKLKKEGTTYKELLEAVRKEITLNYLKKRDTNLYDIVYMLGYSEQSVFNHAFKRWTGMTPGEYRKNNLISSNIN